MQPLSSRPAFFAIVVALISSCAAREPEPTVTASEPPASTTGEPAAAPPPREKPGLAGPADLARQFLRSQGFIGLSLEEARSKIEAMGLASRFRESNCLNWELAGSLPSSLREPSLRYLIGSEPTAPGAAPGSEIVFFVDGDRVVDVAAGLLLGSCRADAGLG